MSEDWIEVDAPPPSTQVKGRLRAFVESRQEHPGVWAQYRPGHPHSSSIAASMMRAYPGLETTQRKRPGDGYDAYARWPESTG